jgi:thiamine-phosphate pyrophosphorylase
LPFALISLPRLYAILDVDLTTASGLEPLELLDAWLDAGIKLVQLRDKSSSGGSLLALAEQAVARARPAGARVIVNDRADIARLADADGVHVGQEDLTATEVRNIVGPERVLGVSTHDPAQVEAACAQPLDYIAIGPVFPSSTRMAVATPLGEAGVTNAARMAGVAGLPVVAIGGITIDNAPKVIAAGASAVAVISGLLDSDPRTRARRFLEALGR